jgi:hypothetical protein
VIQLKIYVMCNNLMKSQPSRMGLRQETVLYIQLNELLRDNIVVSITSRLLPSEDR